jgi:hypothetical protein
LAGIPREATPRLPVYALGATWALCSLWSLLGGETLVPIGGRWLGPCRPLSEERGALGPRENCWLSSCWV